MTQAGCGVLHNERTDGSFDNQSISPQTEVFLKWFASLSDATKRDLIESVTTFIDAKKSGDKIEMLAAAQAVESIRQYGDSAMSEMLTIGEKDAVRIEFTPTKWKEFISHKVRQLRLEREWSQVQLAEKSNLPQSHISRIEQARLSPSHRTVVKLAKAFNVDVGELDPSS